MNKYEFLYSSACAAAGAATGYFYGEWSPLLGILIAFVAIDYATGIIAAIYLKELSSKIGFRGIAKKVLVFLIVAAAHLADQALGTDRVLMHATIYFYLANELISILENAGRTGLPLPQQIKDAVQMLKKK